MSSSSSPPLIASLLLLAVACNSYPSGQHYTIAKVTRNGYLIEAHRALEPADDDDRDDRVGDYLALSLDWGFVRYLQAINTPEVAIFTRVHVHKPSDTVDPPGFIFQNVYMAGDGSDALASIGKGTSVPRMDISIMPPIKYTGETITVEIRAVELDGDDNERAKGLINLAASVAAVTEPANTAAISTFQTVLNFVADSNRDDIEFSFDFQLSKQSDESAYETSKGAKKYAHLPPRVASYVVIKTEDPRRVNLPDTYLGVAAEGLLWTVSNVFQAATLNVLNWDLPFIPARVGNPYRRLLGNPFGVATSSRVQPDFRGDGVLGANIDYAGGSDLGFFEWGIEDDDYAPFVVTNKALRVIPPGDFPGATVACGDNTPVIYRDQSYFYISVSDRASGVSYEQLKLIAEARKAIDNLNINTEGRSIEKVVAGLNGITASATASLMEQQLNETERELKAASTAAEKSQIIAKHKGVIKKLQDNGYLSKEAADSAGGELQTMALGAGLFVVTPEHIAVTGSSNALKLSSSFTLEVAAGMEVKSAFLLAKDGSTQLSSTKLVRSNPEDPSQVVEFDLTGIAEVQEGKYDFIVQTATGNVTVGVVHLWEAPTIESVRLRGDGLVIKGKLLQLASDAELKVGDEDVAVKPEHDKAGGFTVLKLPLADNGEVLDLSSMTLRFTFKDKRPAAEIGLTDDLSLARVIYGGTPIEIEVGASGEVAPNAKVEAPQGGLSYSIEPTLPAGVELNTETGVITFSSPTRLADTKLYTVSYRVGETTLIGKVELSVVAAATEPKPEAGSAGEGDQ